MNINFRGYYDSSQDYTRLDGVIYESGGIKKFFVCLQTHDHTTPQTPNINADTDYWAIWNKSSNFPVYIDEFINFSNLQATDISNYNRYQELFLKSNRTPEEELELNNLVNTLRNKLPLAEDFNKLAEAITSTQAFFKSDVDGYVSTKKEEFVAEINKFTYRGIYSPTTQYYAKNYVTYNDGTGNNTFICIKDSLGNDPTNTTYWVKLGIKGEKGNDGVGLVFKGAWNSSTIYDVGDAVQFGGVIFGAIQASVNQQPDITQDTAYWAKAWDIAVTCTELVGTRTINTVTPNINFITGEITVFNPATDSLSVYKDRVRLTKNVDYVLNADNQSIDKVGGSWDGTSIPIFFEFVVKRNQINNLVFSDGNSIQNGTVTLSKLDLDTQDKINAIGTATLTTTAQTIKEAVNEVNTDLNAHLADKMHIPYAIATGSANAYAVTISPAPTSYVEGLAVAVKINVDNTGASTLNVNGLGAKAIKKPNGLDVSAGNLKAGSVYTLRYNGANFILQGEGGSGNAQPADVLSGKTFTNDIGDQTGTMPNIGAVIITPTTSNQAIPAGYHNGSGYVKGDANLVAGNIRSGVSIFGVAGTVVPYKEASGSVSVPDKNSVTVSGLNFTPRVIVIRYSEVDYYGPYRCYYSPGTSPGVGSDTWHRDPPGSTLDGLSPSFSVSFGQFSFRVPRSSYVPGTAYWFAIGY